MAHLPTIQTRSTADESRKPIVHLRPGEDLWQARLRWQRATGQRGLLLVR